MARLHHIESSIISARRERVFLVLAGIFIGAMAMLNILGITKFIHFGPLELAVGVLPYPLTFLCTDFISELYGRARANFVVWVGLLVNLIVIGFVFVGDAAEPIDFRTPEQRIVTMDYVGVDADGAPVLDPATGYNLAVPAAPGPDGALQPVETIELRQIPGAPDGARQLVDAETGAPLLKEETLFGRIAEMTKRAMLASMIAYLFAQLIDVQLFHFWKRLTNGRLLWLRNNGSTVVSQLVDTVCVVLITFWTPIMSGEIGAEQVWLLIGGAYAFKLVVALLDTIPFYIGVFALRRYLEIPDPSESTLD